MDVIGTARLRAKEKIAELALNPLRQHLTDAMIFEACRSVQHNWNRCLWSPVLIVLACVWKQLKPGESAREVEDWVASLDSSVPFTGCNDGADFCAGRQRLPARVLQILMQKVAANVSKKAGLYFKGLPVWIADGTTLRTVNTPENAKAFGHSRNQARRSRTPILRMTLLVCAGCGAVLATAIGPYVCSEWELFLQMLLEIPNGGLLIADRAYSSFLTFSLMQQRGTHLLTRHNASRRKTRRMRSNGRGDELCEWDKPGSAHVSRPDLLKDCPESLKVRVIRKDIRRRGYRTVKLQIATTLLDPVLYPADEVVDLYLRRWNIELDLRILKSHYGLSRLTGKTPDIQRKEIFSTLLAYNCVIAVMGESGPAVRELSHSRAHASIIRYCERMIAMAAHRLPHEFKCLLALIAHARLTRQERPPQPRAIIQRSSTYPILTMSRKAWRAKHHVA